MGAAGLVLGLFGLIILLGTAVSWGESGNAGGELAMVLGIGLLPAVAGIWMVKSAIQSRSRLRRESLERQILGLASASEGRLTPGMVARETSLTLEESKKILDALHISGFCQTEVSTDGSFSYRFER
ncbi:MAG: hypothetical protein AAF725_00740 [Acidobacteriota bacterium]